METLAIIILIAWIACAVSDTSIPTEDLRDMEKDQDENPQNWDNGTKG